MFHTLIPFDLQEYIHNIACKSVHQDVMDELTDSVTHDTYYDNGGFGDDHLELPEHEIERRGLLQEAKEHWCMTTQLHVEHLDLNVCYSYGESSYRGSREWFQTLHCWAETPGVYREVLLRQQPKQNKVLLKVSERPIAKGCGCDDCWLNKESM